MRGVWVKCVRTFVTALLLISATACSGGGINAGEKGGEAFIAFTVMLIIGGAILWFALGRED
jgi:hypothetical protein